MRIPRRCLSEGWREEAARGERPGSGAFGVNLPPASCLRQLAAIRRVLPRRRFSHWLGLWATLSLALSSGLVVGATELAARQLDAGSFRIAYDLHGVTGLANPKDPFEAQLLASGQRLGLVVRYWTGETNWVELPANSLWLADSSARNRLVYTNDLSEAQLKVTQTFHTDGKTLDWDIDLETIKDGLAEIGDLAISIPAVGPRGEDPKQIFERGFLKHQFISGNGSFLYFVRASGVPPFLLVTVQPGTRLEYFSGGFGRGSALVFIHSGLTGGKETRATWRQAHTFLKLGPVGASVGHAHYGFRFHWAQSYDDLRESLYQAGLFDIRCVPGMTMPVDLTARFALHTRARIESVEAEFPAQTKIIKLDQKQPDYHLYEVLFTRLGENRLTIQHDGGKKTYLEYFVTEPLETLIKKRAAFIINRQQIRDPSKWWDGVFAPYDMKNHVVRTVEDPDIFRGRMVYVLTCDDPGLCKAPFVAEKNVSFPEPQEIEGLEYYLKHFVWGRLQRTDKEQPYPYGVYGTPNWYTDRDPERRKVAAGSNPTAVRDLTREHVWRSYDYPHVVMLYYHMYELARRYPRLSKYLDAAGYLERAYQTAHAFFTYPYEIYPTYYETYKWGLYNELVVLKLADALDAEGFADRADWLRGEWEKKAKYFVYDDPYPFRSEYAFDRTAFESSYAFAKYGATHDLKPDTNLWFDVKLKKWYSHPRVRPEDFRAFMERQLAAGLSVRGWLETSYYQLGADGGLSYMAAMGGWGILDYAVNFALEPSAWLQLGYASFLSSWCLMNTGPPECNYGFWFPGQANDGAAGWQFMSAKYGHAWMGADVPRGPWPYDGEIDLGFGSALRMAATVLTRDPVFDWLAYGGTLTATNNSLSVIPQDGLRQRFYAIVGGANDPQAPIRRLKLELDRDGFAVGRNIVTDKLLKHVAFTLENRTGDNHRTSLWLSPPLAAHYVVTQDNKKIALHSTGNWDYPLRADLNIARTASRIELAESKHE
jgi:hypothetical protein